MFPKLLQLGIDLSFHLTQTCRLLVEDSSQPPQRSSALDLIKRGLSQMDRGLTTRHHHTALQIIMYREPLHDITMHHDASSCITMHPFTLRRKPMHQDAS